MVGDGWGSALWPPPVRDGQMTGIRMLVDVAYPAGLLHGDQAYDLPAGEAEAMVIIGWAEYAPDDDPLQVYEQQYDHVQALNPRRGETL